jgi:hypothetical protein
MEEKALGAALKEHLPLLIICLLYMLGIDILSTYISELHPEFDYYTLSTILLYNLQFYFAGGICVAAFLLLYLIGYFVRNHRVKPFWRQFAISFKNRFLTARQIYGSIIIFLLIPLFFAFIAMYKQLIPFVKPYCWDNTFMQWDYVLHFHHNPWQLLQPILGHPLITAFLGKAYGAWFFVLVGIIIWQGNTAERFYRMQFFLTFMLAWLILGTWGAYYFSSAGPCYYNIYSPASVNPYDPLMLYLSHNAPAWVIDLQGSLLEHLQSNTLVFGGGVSAMPSMHVAMATLCLLICSKYNRWLALAAGVFLILVLIGSIHLAWHYAVDGYVAIILTSLIWYYTGKVLRYAQHKKI